MQIDSHGVHPCAVETRLGRDQRNPRSGFATGSARQPPVRPFGIDAAVSGVAMHPVRVDIHHGVGLLDLLGQVQLQLGLILLIYDPLLPSLTLTDLD